MRDGQQETEPQSDIPGVLVQRGPEQTEEVCMGKVSLVKDTLIFFSMDTGAPLPQLQETKGLFDMHVFSDVSVDLQLFGTAIECTVYFCQGAQINIRIFDLPHKQLLSHS